MKEDNKILVRELIDKYDQNKDGVLSFAEFKELIKEFQVPGIIG
jgi:Ca2+-binding EF-hand superfamily protein